MSSCRATNAKRLKEAHRGNVEAVRAYREAVRGEGLAVRARRAKALEQLEAAQTEARQEVGVSRR